jgi:hypothetical protein
MTTLPGPLKTTAFIVSLAMFDSQPVYYLLKKLKGWENEEQWLYEKTG